MLEQPVYSTWGVISLAGVPHDALVLGGLVGDDQEQVRDPTKLAGRPTESGMCKN